MTAHYPRTAIAADYARSATGLALAVGALLFVELSASLIWVLAAVAGLFLVYFARAVARHSTRVELDGSGVRTRGPFGAAIPWNDLRFVRLRHFTTRSDRSEGWMQLDVRGTRESMQFDSRLEGFASLALAVAREAQRHGIDLDESTRVNLGALGSVEVGHG